MANGSSAPHSAAHVDGASALPTSSTASTTTASAAAAADEPTESTAPLHLLVAVHGLWGEPRHLNSLCKALVLRHGGVLLKHEALERAASSKRPPSPRDDRRAAGVDSATSKGPGGEGRGDARKSTESIASTIHTVNEAPQRASRSWLKGLIREPSQHDDSEDEVEGAVDVGANGVGADVGGRGGAGSEPHRAQRRGPRRRRRHRLVVLNTRSNAGAHTYDGIDWLAERAAREVFDAIEALPHVPQDQGGGKVERISFLGYSLGGLICRYLVALVLSHPRFLAAGRIEPYHVTTLATPHLGMPPGKGTFARFAEAVGSRLLSRTGEQLYVRDSGWHLASPASHDDAAAPPGQNTAPGTSRAASPPRVALLSAMADPDSAFVAALRRFRTVTFYANALHDVTVPLRTGAAVSYDPMLALEAPRGDPPRVVVVREPDYPAVVRSIWILPPGHGEDGDDGGGGDGEGRPDAPPTAWLRARRWLRRTARSIRRRAPRLPFLLDPKRYPFPAPLNYVAVVALPVLFPLLVTVVLYRFSRETARSKRRLRELRAAWREAELDGRARGAQDDANGDGGKDADDEDDGDGTGTHVRARRRRRGRRALDAALDDRAEAEVERGRVERVLRGVVQSVAEERVEDAGADAPQGNRAGASSSRPTPTSTRAEDSSSAGVEGTSDDEPVLPSPPVPGAVLYYDSHVEEVMARRRKLEAQRDSVLPRKISTSTSSSSSLPSPALSHPSEAQLREQAKVLAPLSDVQLRMARQLGGVLAAGTCEQDLSGAVPQLRRRLVWFDDVINSHAIIIARLPAMEMHRRGLPVLRHYADHFEV